MDITSKSFEDLLSNTLNSRKLDVIMSDMAPNLTGIHFQDHIRSLVNPFVMMRKWLESSCPWL